MRKILRNIIVVVLLSFSVRGHAQDTKVNHPAASTDGLSRIDSEGNYIYDSNDALRNNSMSFRVGTVNNPQISVLITQHNTNDTYEVNFDDMYDGASKLSIGFDYEYFFTITGGKLGLQGGFSAQYAEGNGRLAASPTTPSIEKFTFVTVPLFLGAVYRFEYRDRQLFAPYLAGGGSYVALLEKREDVSDVNAIGSFGFYGAGGLLFNLSALNRDMGETFKGEYNISNMWINLEFRTVQVASEAFNYDNSFVQGGMSFDF